MNDATMTITREMTSANGHELRTTSQWQRAFGNQRNDPNHDCYSCRVVKAVLEEAYAMNDAYAPGVKALSGVTPEVLEGSLVVTPDRDAQGAALATMRRREAQALEDLAAARRDLAAASVARQPITNPRDERVMPIWIQAARVAQDEGFCSEYDRLARQLNVPTRDELKEGGFLDRPGTVTVRVTIDVRIPVSDIDDAEIEDSEVDEALSEYLSNEGVNSNMWWATSTEADD